MATEAEDEKAQASGQDFSKFFDVAKEDEQMVEVIKTAFTKVDNKTGAELENPDNKWTVYNTKDDRVQVVFRMVDPKAGVYTIRGSTKLNIGVDDMYEFLDCRYDDEQDMLNECDQLQKEWKLVKNYDADHRCIYTSYDTGFPTWIIWPRDFNFMKRRAQFKNYVVKEGNEEVKYDIAMAYTYSVGEDHPDYVAVQAKHVRATIHQSAYVFYTRSDAADKNSCDYIYIVSVDPSGSIPQKVVNYSAPAQGMSVKGYLDNLDKIKERLKKRRESKK